MSPSINHAYVQAKLISALIQLGKYTVYSELSLDIEGKEYVPDIVLYKDRKPDYQHDETKVSEIPLLAIEILSPTQGIQEIINKFEIYFQAGAKSCWLVQPFPRSVAVLSPKLEETIYSGDEVIDSILNIKIPFNTIFE